MVNSIVIGCDKGELTSIRQFVADELEKQEIPDLEAHKLVLAVDEVCANLIIHANNCDPVNKIELQLEISPKQIIFTFKDKGIGFDINEYQSPSMDELISTRRQGGIGLLLVKRIMDKIEFTTEKNYNICRLVKTLA